MNRDFQIKNKTSREKMRELIEGMTDGELALPAVAGWTVAATFAHVAFWDFRILHLLRLWRENEIVPSPYDVDAINEAQKPLCMALPPRTAAELALKAALEIDSEIEAASDDLVKKIQDANVQFKFERNGHREYHIKEIEQVLAVHRAT